MATATGVGERLLDAWRDEVEASIVYELIAQREGDPRRAEVLRRLARVEASHRQQLERRMRELGIVVPDEATVQLSRWRRLQAKMAPVERLLARQEERERELSGEPGEGSTGDGTTDQLLERIRGEEETHTEALADLRRGKTPRVAAPPPANPAQDRLSRMLGRERWHRGGRGWISGVIYGANDGLAAVFGIVAGVSGATGGSHFVLTAGLAGAIASALSMATGAYLAERSSHEVAEANLARERSEVLKHPEEEKEELSLFYQLKGLTEAEADMLVARIAEDPEQLLAAIALEEFGGAGPTEHNAPVWAGVAAGLSTAAGAIIPVIPFFFLTGAAGVATAAGVSLLAHFAVGAAKSLFTLRSAWWAGLEMTAAGVLVGGATFLLGLAFPIGT